MELFRASEALLRSSQPLLPFLAPAAYRTSTPRIAAPVARHCRGRAQCQTSRAFTTTHHRRQDDPPTSRAQSINDDISSLLDSSLDLDGKSPTAPTSRTSRFSSRDAQQNNPISRGLANEQQPNRDKSSVDDLIDSMGSPSPRSQKNTTSYSADDISRMLDPLSTSNPGAPPAIEDDGPVMKLGPSLGRTVEVNPARGMDVGRAFRTLEMQCARNSVKRDFMMQRFHERPGLKRKRLKSVRWRRNFKKNFQATVALVQKMTRQGW